MSAYYLNTSFEHSNSCSQSGTCICFSDLNNFDATSIGNTIYIFWVPWNIGVYVEFPSSEIKVTQKPVTYDV